MNTKMNVFLMIIMVSMFFLILNYRSAIVNPMQQFSQSFAEMIISLTDKSGEGNSSSWSFLP